MLLNMRMFSIFTMFCMLDCEFIQEKIPAFMQEFSLCQRTPCPIEDKGFFDRLTPGIAGEFLFL